MKPGATIMPDASSTRSASEARTAPISAIFPSLIPTSARTRGIRRPSTTIPPRIAVSKRAKASPPGGAASGGLAEQDGQAVGGAEREAADAALRAGVQAEVRKPLQQRGRRDTRLHACQVRADAVVRAETEGDVIALVRPVQVEAIGIREATRVGIGRSEREGREVALRDAIPVQVDVAGDLPRDELHRRV